MECMCSQTRPRLYILIRKSFGGMESEPMITPREKSPLPEKFSSEEDGTHDAASSRTASPTHYQRCVKQDSEPNTLPTLRQAGQRAQHTTNAASSRTASQTHYQRCVKQDSEPNTLPTLRQAGQRAQHTTNAASSRTASQTHYQRCVKQDSEPNTLPTLRQAGQRAKHTTNAASSRTASQHTTNDTQGYVLFLSG